MESAPSRLAVAFSLFACACLVGTGIYGIAFWALRDTGPAASEFPPAATIVRAEHRPDDLVFLVPAYATRAREFLGDLHPLAVRDPLAEDLDVHPRAWVFGLFGGAEDLRAEMTRAGLSLERTWTPSSGITIDRYLTGAAMKTAYSFREHVRDARVHHEKDGQTTPCDEWSDTNGQGGATGRWSCKEDREWFYVAPEWHRMGDHLRACLWVHPPNAGRLVLRYTSVPMTGRLFGRGGHTLNASKRAHAPVDLEVKIGDAPSARFRFELDDTFRTFSSTTATVGTATVTFAVSTSNAGANHFCFDAEMRAPRSEP